MSSPSSTITILDIDENVMIVRIRPETYYLGLLNGYGFTRSYMLAALAWYPYFINSDIEPQELKICQLVNEIAIKESIEFWSVDEEFYINHIDKFILSTEIKSENLSMKKTKLFGS
jgi:hypothetical protein